MPLNRQDEKNWQRLQVLELSYKGNSYREISRTLDISLGSISTILHEISEETKNEVHNSWFNELIPLELKKRLLKMDWIDKTAFGIVDNSKDDRVRLQALAILQANDEKRFNVLLDGRVIDEAIQFKQRQNISKEIVSQQQEGEDEQPITVNDDDE
jgi:hypothetical protein